MVEIKVNDLLEMYDIILDLHKNIRRRVYSEDVILSGELMDNYIAIIDDNGEVGPMTYMDYVFIFSSELEAECMVATLDNTICEDFNTSIKDSVTITTVRDAIAKYGDKVTSLSKYFTSGDGLRFAWLIYESALSEEYHVIMTDADGNTLM